MPYSSIIGAERLELYGYLLMCEWNWYVKVII